MSDSISLGEFEQVVLLAILRCHPDAYGATVLNMIAECTGRMPSAGALYTTLQRLEAKELLQSKEGAPTPERGGRNKRFLEVTSTGRRALIRSQENLRKLSQGLELLPQPYLAQA